MVKYEKITIGDGKMSRGNKIGKTATERITIIPEPEKPLKKKASVWLLLMFAASVVLRFVLALLLRHGPTVIIDESLYINIAKSLALEGKIAYRGQPVDYMYILYPLLLTPLYLLKLPFDMYRVIQLYNAILISTCVFPAYLFAKEFTGSERKALFSAGVTLLMPDMAMAGFMMSECVIWPLSLWVFCFAMKLYKNEGKAPKWGILTGTFSALLFWTKPGSFAFGAVLLIFALIAAWKEKDKTAIRAAAAGIAALAVLIAIFYGIYVFGFGYDMSVLGLYDKQLTEVNGRWIAGASEASVLQVMLLAMAAGGIYAVFPFAYLREYESVQRKFILATAAGIIIAAIGTAVLVVMYQWNESLTNMQLHMRYMAMFVPVLFIFSQPVACRKGGTSKGFLIALAVMAGLMIFPGARVGSVLGESTNIDSMALAAFFRHRKIETVWGIITIICSVTFIVFLMMEISRELSPALKRICKGYFLAFLLVNSICVYISGNVKVDRKVTEDALAANKIVEEEEGKVLGVTQQYYNEIMTYWLEARIRRPIQHVTIDNMVVAMEKTKGVYAPFVPIDQSPNIHNGETPEVNALLLEATIAEHLELNPELEAETTPNGINTLVHLKEGERWADTMLFGMNNNTLAEGKTATLCIFDEERIAGGELAVSVTAYAKTEGTKLAVSNGGKSFEIELSAEEATYEFTVSSGSIAFTAKDGDAEILRYSTAVKGV